MDGVNDGIIVAFALWTLFYQLALVFQFSMLWAAWPSLLITLVVVAVGGLRGWRFQRHVKASPSRNRARPPWPYVVAGGAALTMAILGRPIWGVWPVAAVAICLIVIQLLPVFRTAGTDDTPPAAPGEPSSAAHLFALVVSIGFGVLGSFLLRPDADDVFYVNRATWVATHGTAALNDTMFSPNTLPPAYSGGIPTPSIEAAQGVVAHALGVDAPTVCYLLAVPILGAAAGWTTWRLVREWASRRWVWVMAASMLFLLASGSSILGNYSLGRIWQGKAIAYAILVPLIWLFLSRTVSRARGSDVLMLAAAGVSFVGLTTSSALMAPIICGAALLAAAVLRSRSLLTGALAFTAAPLLNGIVQVAGPAAIAGGGDNVMRPASGAFNVAFGPNLAMATLSVCALVLTPQLADAGRGVLLACGSVLTMLTLFPGVFELFDALTGAGAVAWRLVIAMPTWVLVGLLVAVPHLPKSLRHPDVDLARAVTGVALVSGVFLVPLVGGAWLWDVGGARLTRYPTWKVDQAALADVRAARELEAPPGLWLMPSGQMQILTISTVETQAVVPRLYYVPTLSTSGRDVADRLVLFRLAQGQSVPVSRVRSAMGRLDVSVACVPSTADKAARALRRAVKEKLTPVERMACYVSDAS